MTTPDPITVPDGTTIQSASARRTTVEAREWDYFGIARRFATTIELDGDITVDLTKPVYILQFDDEGPQE